MCGGALERVLDNGNVLENNITSDSGSLPTLHQIMQKQAAESWGRIRSSLLTIAIESEALPEEKLCFICITTEASYRCLQCSPILFYCSECLAAAHSKTYLFHRAEIWEVSI